MKNLNQERLPISETESAFRQLSSGCLVHFVAGNPKGRHQSYFMKEKLLMIATIAIKPPITIVIVSIISIFFTFSNITV